MKHNENLAVPESFDQRESEFLKSQEFKEFIEFCGGGIERKYREGEIDGLVLSYIFNRFLKKQGNAETLPSNTGESFTREAFGVAVDPEAYQRERDSRIISTFPQKENTSFRVKDIKYGNGNAMHEVLSSQLYGLCGLAAPDNRFLLLNETDKRTNGAPKVFVASPLIAGYYDLGDFLTNQSVLCFIKGDNKKIARWYDLKNQIEEINKKSTSGQVISGEDKLRRIKLYGQIYEMMPNYFHHEIEKAYGVSKFVFNWDFANFTLSNIGCRFILDRDRNVVGFESVFVDFGNSGVIGFGGGYKEASLLRANNEAKKRSDKPNDYDPQLEFTREEWDLIWSELENLNGDENEESAIRKAILNLYNKRSVLYEDQKKLLRQIIFKDSHHITSSQAQMGTDSMTSILSLSDLPRNIPFAPIIQTVIKKKNQEALLPSPQSIANDSAMYSESEIEVAFRLSLISDRAIEIVAKKWFLAERFPNVFPILVEFQKNDRYNTAEEIAKIFKERRDALVGKIPKQVIDDWVGRNPLIAISVEQEVKIAILSKTNTANLDFDFEQDQRRENPLPQEMVDINRGNSFRERIANAKHIEPVMPIKAIIFDIERHKENVEKEVNNLYKSQKEFIDNLAAQAANNGSLKNFFDKKKEEMNLEIEQKIFEKMMVFIEINCKKWQNDLNLEPNCKLFNLRIVRQYYQSQSYDFSDSTIVSEKEKNDRNSQIASCNKAIYQQFMKNLKEISKMNRASEAPELRSLKPLDIRQSFLSKI